jgi:hypothetical protein
VGAGRPPGNYHGLLVFPAKPFEDIMTSDQLIPWLFGVTLVIVLVAGIYQYFRVRRSQRLGTPAVPDASPSDQTSGRIGDPARR